MKAYDDKSISRKADELWRFAVRCSRSHPNQHYYAYFSTQEAGIKYMNEEGSEEAQRLKVEELITLTHPSLDVATLGFWTWKTVATTSAIGEWTWSSKCVHHWR